MTCSYSDGRTAFEVVCLARNWGNARTLVEANADVNAKFSGTSPSAHSSVEMPSCLNYCFADGRTALEVAFVAKDWKGIRILLELKADIQAAYRAPTSAKTDDIELRRCVRAPSVYDWEAVWSCIGMEGDIDAKFEGNCTLNIFTLPRAENLWAHRRSICAGGCKP